MHELFHENTVMEHAISLSRKTCPCHAGLMQVARRRLAQSVLGFILKMLREWRRAENCLNHCSAKPGMDQEWYLGRGSWLGTEHGLSHYWLPWLVSLASAFHLFLPKLSLSSVADSLCSPPQRFGLFMAALLFFFEVSFPASLASVCFPLCCVWHSDLLREGLRAVGILDEMQPLSWALVLGPLPGHWPTKR